MTDDPGTTVSYADDARRYRLDSRIATGGMGEVWRATDTSLDREVAIKLLKHEYAGDPLFRQRFEAEARHAAVLHHPGVAAVYDVGESLTGDGLPRPYLVMELVDGQPLSALLRRGEPLDPQAVRELLTQAADALGAAHAAGIVHRDVKPANLLVTRDRVVKVTDFGIARALSSSALTSTGQVMGTPQYLSPEQARGETATPASDVYGLGVVAFECLTGHRPFEKESPVATALAHLHDPVPPLPDSVPADLAAVVGRALAKVPAERYPDASAFAAALRGTGEATTQVVPLPMTPAADAPATQVLPATGVLPLAGAAAAAGAAGGAASAAPPPQREDGEDQRRRSNGPLIAVVLAAIALVALATWWAFGRDTDTTDVPPAPVTPSVSASESPRESPTPSETASESATIDLDEGDYLGRDVDEVVDDLRGLGLDPEPVAIANPGDEQAGTVADVTPTRGLEEGDAVTVSYYREAQQEEDEGEEEEEPTGAPSPTRGPTRSPSPQAPDPTQGQTSNPDQGAPSGSSTTPVATAPSTPATQSGRTVTEQSVEDHG